MFFDFALLHRQNNGQFFIAWKAATLGVKEIPQKKILEVKIDSLCDELAKFITSNATSPKGRFSLRLSSFLLSGTIRLYREQVVIQLDEILKFFTTIRMPLEFGRSKVSLGGSSEETDFSIFRTPPKRKPKVRGIKRTRPQQESQGTPENELEELQRTLDEINKGIEFPPPARQDEITIREEQPIQAFDHLLRYMPNPHLEKVITYPDLSPSEFGTLGLPGVTPFDPEGMLNLPEVIPESSRMETTEEQALLKKPSRKRKQQEANKENILPPDSQTHSSSSEPQSPSAHRIVTSADVHVNADVSSPKKPRTPKKSKTPSETKQQVRPSTDLDLIEEIASSQVVTPVVPVVQAEEEEPFPLASDQPVKDRPKRPIHDNKLMPKVKRRVVGRRHCRLAESGLNELYKSTKQACNDFDNDYDEQTLDVDEILNQLPPVITALPQLPVEPDALQREPLLPLTPRSLEISVQRHAPLVRFSAAVDLIEFPIQKGVDNTINDTVAVAGQAEHAMEFLDDATTNTPMEGIKCPSTLQIRPLESIEEEGVQMPTQPEETPKSSRPRFEYVESPQANADSHVRQKKIVNLVKQENRVYTIEEVCPHPVNKFNIACTFADLLALSGRSYVNLVPEEESSELKSIIWGQRLNRE